MGEFARGAYDGAGDGGMEKGAEARRFLRDHLVEHEDQPGCRESGIDGWVCLCAKLDIVSCIEAMEGFLGQSADDSTGSIQRIQGMPHGHEGSGGGAAEEAVCFDEGDSQALSSCSDSGEYAGTATAADAKIDLCGNGDCLRRDGNRIHGRAESGIGEVPDGKSVAKARKM